MFCARVVPQTAKEVLMVQINKKITARHIADDFLGHYGRKET